MWTNSFSFLYIYQLIPFLFCRFSGNSFLDHCWWIDCRRQEVNHSEGVANWLIAFNWKWTNSFTWSLSFPPESCSSGRINRNVSGQCMDGFSSHWNKFVELQTTTIDVINHVVNDSEWEDWMNKRTKNRSRNHMRQRTSHGSATHFCCVHRRR